MNMKREVTKTTLLHDEREGKKMFMIRYIYVRWNSSSRVDLGVRRSRKSVKETRMKYGIIGVPTPPSITRAKPDHFSWKKKLFSLSLRHTHTHEQNKKAVLKKKSGK